MNKVIDETANPISNRWMSTGLAEPKATKKFINKETEGLESRGRTIKLYEVEGRRHLLRKLSKDEYTEYTEYKEGKRWLSSNDIQYYSAMKKRTVVVPENTIMRIDKNHPAPKTAMMLPKLGRE